MIDLAPEEDAYVREPADPVTLHRLLGLTDEEHDKICRTLGRDPGPAELGMYSVMWSEHCSYKSSRVHLRRFPTQAPWVVVGPGENAGVIDVGEGWLAAIRIESHNHPSFVEPYQGAATGVGGIIRDIFTMGARPVALWDQIRFGPLDQPRNRYLFAGAVSGIGGYGNAVGVPTVGGEVAFDDSYSGNPLINVACLGLLRSEDLVLGRSGPPGTKAVLLGAATGRDGIGGASILASASFADGEETKRPAVQVGDPFTEKKLIEACLELFKKKLVIGVQDLGAAGLSCAISEPPARSGTGIRVDLAQVHARETGMTASELLMSESQERMLAFIEPERLQSVLEIAQHWEIGASVIGEVTDDGIVSVFYHDVLEASVPAISLTEDAPRYWRPLGEPQWMEDLWGNAVTFVTAPDLADALLDLLDHPSIASSRWVYEQYDHMLFLNTVIGPGDDGALIRIADTNRGLAVSTDGNGPICYLDPRRGAGRLVYESALNVAITGARPMAVVDNLNFGNPEKPEIMWQFRETIEGISEACEALGLPVIGGNVSFYNETDGIDIYPTPIIAVLGLAETIPPDPPRHHRALAGMQLWRFGPEWAISLAGSAFAEMAFGHLGGRPTAPDSTMAKAAIEAARRLAGEGLAAAIHDISDGGLAVAVSELAIASKVGVSVDYTDWRSLFSEDPHRFVAAIASDRVEEVTALVDQIGIPAAKIGEFGGDEIAFIRGGRRSSVDLGLATTTYGSAIPRRMSGREINP